ncbi:MAG: amino acid adenylation domain-containing protein [Cumulibacter sp.]
MSDARAQLLSRILAGAKITGIDKPAHRVHSGPVPASEFQKGLWFIEQLNDGLPLYNMTYCVRLTGRLDVDALHRAVADLPNRHDALRTGLTFAGGQCVQTRVEDVEIPWTARTASETDVPQLVREFALAPFTLAEPPLARAALWQLPDLNYVFCLTVHHAVADGRSMAILLRDVNEHYCSGSVGRRRREDDLTYADFALQQHGSRTSGEIQAHLEWWHTTLGDRPSTPAPSSRSRQSRPDLRRREHGAVALSETLKFTADETTSIQRLAQQCGTTPFTIGVATLVAQIAAHRGAADSAPTIGTAIDRRGAHFADVVGHFVNTVLVRPPLEDDPTFAAWITRCASTVAEAIGHGDVAFSELVAELGPTMGAELCPVYFVEQSGISEHSIGDASAIPVDLDEAPAQFDLVAHWALAQGALTIEVIADSDAYEQAGLLAFCRRWRDSLLSAVRTPHASVSTVLAADRSVLHGAPTERQWQHPADAVFDWARRTPNVVAIQHGSDHVTYRQLAARVNAVACRLRELGAGPDTFVAVDLPHSIDLLVTVLAAGTIGAAYTCLDPRQPRHRREGIIAQLPNCLTIDSAFVERFTASNKSDAADGAHDGSSVAYVLFTSGSTGEPKGVQVSRDNLTYLLATLADAVGLGAADVIGWHTTPTFDMSVPELYLAFLVGARVEIIDPQIARTPRDLLQALERITLLQATPTLWRSLLDEGPLPQHLRRLVGAEPVPLDIARRLADGIAFNVYGPTETTVWSTIAQLNTTDDTVTIGQPLPGTTAYLIDEHGSLVPRGEVGELCLAGHGVSRGYLNRPTATAAAFVPTPDGTAIMYRTGDLARITNDGNLLCLGRRDHQLKIRGYRVEPGEIENVLQTHPLVRHAVVAAEPTASGTNRLIAQIVPTLDTAARRRRYADSNPAALLKVRFADGMTSLLPADAAAPDRLLHGGRIAELTGDRVTDALPDPGLLADIVRAASSRLNGGGCIQIRGIRDHRLTDARGRAEQPLRIRYAPSGQIITDAATYDDARALALAPSWWHQFIADDLTAIATVPESFLAADAHRYDVQLRHRSDAHRSDTHRREVTDVAWNTEVLSDLCTSGGTGITVVRGIPDAGSASMLTAAEDRDPFCPAGLDRREVCARARAAGTWPTLLTTQTPGEVDLALLPDADVPDGLQSLVGGSSGTSDPGLALLERDLAGEFRAHVAAALPEYMVPVAYRCMSEFPLTSNGKVDRQSIRDTLAAPEHVDAVPAPRPLGDLLADAARRFASFDALDDGQSTLTYAELDAVTSRLARRLITAGARRGDRVALHLNRGAALPLAALAAAKVGAAFIAIDPALPEARAAAIFEAVAPTVTVIAQGAAAPATTGRVVLHENDPSDARGDGTPISDLERGGPLRVDDPAYLIFTSGSTGTPKGVVNTSRGLAAMATTVEQRLDSLAGQRLLQLSAPSFDAFVFELVCALVNGACLVCARDADVRPGPELVATLKQRRVSVAVTAPSVLAVLGPYDLPASCTVLLVGEALPAALVDRWAHRIRLHNAYGPSEASIMGAMSGPLVAGQPVTIGTTPLGTEAVVLDENASPVPEGEVGELYLVGDCVGHGYLDAPELTAARFGYGIGTDPTAPYFRTGDLVRCQDNQLYFVGRVDDQVQVRGVRVEPAEIEAAICAVPGVQIASVVDVADDAASRRLVSYYTGDAHPDGVRDLLRTSLPPALVPDSITRLTELPTNASGKIDRTALRAGAASTPATSDQQTISLLPDVVAAWEEVLGTIPDADADFFNSGGHSLRAAELAFRLRDRGHDIGVADIYEHPSARRLDAYLRAETDNSEGIDLAADARLDETIRALPSVPRPAATRAFLLTGATGFTGAHLLHHLLRSTDAHAYVLVRADNDDHAQRRLLTTLRERNLLGEGGQPRITALAGDLATPGFGIEAELYRRIAAECDAIYHCAADVNLVSDYRHMRDTNVAGTTEIIRFAAAERCSTLHHVSTTSVVLGMALQRTVIDEDTPVPTDAVLPTGYVMTKWVAEQLVLAARERGIPSNIYRLSRVWGPTDGDDHNSCDAFLQFLRASIAVGALADGEDGGLPQMGVDIVPVDYVASAIVKLSECLQDSGHTYHLTHPNPPAFGAFGDRLRAAGYYIEPVALDEWTHRVAADAERSDSGAEVRNSAVIRQASANLPELGDYALDRTNSDRDLAGALPCPPIDAAQLDRYISQLRSRGELPPPSIGART